MMNTGTEGMGFAGVDVAKYASNPSIPPPLTAGDALGPDHRTFVARTRLEEPWIIDFDEVDGVPDFVELEGRTSWIYHVAISHDGSLIAAFPPGEPDILLWETATGRLLARIKRAEGDTGEYLALWNSMHDAYLVFSKNDDALFTTDQVGTQVISVRVDLTTGKVSRRPVELEEAHRVGFEASGDARLSQTTCLLNRHPSTQESGRRILLSPNGRKPATLDPDGTVRCVGPCVAGRPVSLGGADGVRIVNPDTGVEDQQVRSLPGVLVHALAYSPIGRLFAAGTNDGRVFLLDTQFHEIGFEFQAHPPGRDFVGRQPDYPQYQYIRDVRWSPDGTMLITASGDGTVCVWDARRLAERRRQRESHVKRTAAMRESSATHATSEILHDPSMPADDRSAARIVAIESWSATARSSESWRSAQQDN